MTEKYTENIIVKYSENDQNLAMKPYALLNHLQDIANKNSQDNDFGQTYLSFKNCAWFLIKYRMEFSDYPINVSKLTLTTEPRGYKKIFSYRDFELKSDKGTIGRISSQWAIIDMNTHSMVNIGEALDNNPCMPIYTSREDDLKFDKILPPQTSEISETFEVRYNDLDMNGHANNGNYIIWGFEPLDFDFKNSHKIKTLDIIFKKEAKYKEQVTSQVSFTDENTSVHKITNAENEELCLIKCVWTKL